MSFRRTGGREVNSQQSSTIREYENELGKRGRTPAKGWRESTAPESRGVLFADVAGVTLMVYPDGLINIPSRCSWSFDKYTHITAAACASELWARQKQWDDARPDAARNRAGGHLGPIVATDLKCDAEGCPCQKETPSQRQSRARGAYNAMRDARKERYKNDCGCP